MHPWEASRTGLVEVLEKAPRQTFPLEKNRRESSQFHPHDRAQPLKSRLLPPRHDDCFGSSGTTKPSCSITMPRWPKTSATLDGT